MLKLERVAEFAVTQVAFNPLGKYLACSSVSNSISLVKLDEDLEVQSQWIRKMIMDRIFLILAIIAFILAIVLRYK